MEFDDTISTNLDNYNEIPLSIINDLTQNTEKAQIEINTLKSKIADININILSELNKINNNLKKLSEKLIAENTALVQQKITIQTKLQKDIQSNPYLPGLSYVILPQYNLEDPTKAIYKGRTQNIETLASGIKGTDMNLVRNKTYTIVWSGYFRPDVTADDWQIFIYSDGYSRMMFDNDANHQSEGGYNNRVATLPMNLIKGQYYHIYLAHAIRSTITVSWQRTNPSTGKKDQAVSNGKGFFFHEK